METQFGLVLDVLVRGIPAPQGSKKTMIHPKTGKPVTMESSKKVKPWRDAVRSDVAKVWTAAALDEPISLSVWFAFERPKSHFGTGRNAGRVKPSAPTEPSGRPDLDKLLRSTMDGLTDAGVWRDDSRVVAILAGKVYCTPGAFEHPGAVIRVRTAGSRA